MRRLFEVGDKIKGKKNNDYGITNEQMTLAEVIEVDDDEEMNIKILEHNDKDNKGKEFWVTNTTDYFELVDNKTTISLPATKVNLTAGCLVYSIPTIHPTLHFGYLGGKKLPKEYYINEKKKTVVLKWDDDTITKVKTSKDDKFNAKFGFLLAYFQKNCGMSRTQANKYIDNLKVDIEKKKVSKKEVK